jgi:hypothetical protein
MMVESHLIPYRRCVTRDQTNTNKKSEVAPEGASASTHKTEQAMATYLATEVMSARANHQTTENVAEWPYLKWQKL